MAKVRVEKRLYYKIGEACKALGIQPYVLRYWETEFPALAPSKSRSGQRVYSEKEMEVIRRIKELLYDEGYTIAGAKKKLEAELAAGSLEAPEGTEAPSLPPPLTSPAEPAKPVALVPQKPAPPLVAAKPKARPAASPRPVPASSEAAEAVSEPAPLDTDATQRIQSLLSGIDEALGEAREILVLLDRKSP
jgi:DNA-binding transcriptional MerR regulator